MKKLNILFSIIVILITILSIGLVSAVPTGGISYYPFDEGTGTTLGDDWGSNDGTIDGATWSSTVPTYNISGSPDYSLSFDGTDDLLMIPDASSLDLSGTKSINFWLYDSQSGAGSTETQIFGKPDRNMGMSAHDSNDVYYFRSGTTYLSISRTIKNSWFMITIVQDSGTTYIYVNNVLKTSGTLNYDWDNTDNIYIGSESGTSRFFDGLFTNIQFFDTALNSTQISNLYGYGSIDITVTPSENHSLETNVLIEQIGETQINSNTYQLIISNDFIPVNDSNVTFSASIEVESAKDMDIECKVLINGTDYDTETSRSFDSASIGNMYLTSSVFEVNQNESVNLQLYCRRTSVNGRLKVRNGVGIVSLLTNENGININTDFISNTFQTNTSSYRLIANTTFLTGNQTLTNLTRQLVFDGKITYNYTSASTIELYSVINGVTSPMFNRYGTAGTTGNGGNFNIAYNLTNETEVPILLYAKSSSSDGSVNVNLNIKEMIGHIQEFNSTSLATTSLTSTTWATAKTIVINNSEHTDGDILVKSTISTISTSGDQEVEYRLYYNGTAYSPEYLRNINNDGSGVSVLQYLFRDIGTGLFNVELQYKVQSSANIVGGSLIAYVSGDIIGIPNNFYVTANDKFNSSSILDFNVTLNEGAVFFESNTTGYASVNSYDGLINFTIKSDGYYDLDVINWNSTINYSANLTRYVYATFNNYWNGSLINDFNVTIDNIVTISSSNMLNPGYAFDNDNSTRASVDSCGILGYLYANYSIVENNNYSIQSYSDSTQYTIPTGCKQTGNVQLKYTSNIPCGYGVSRFNSYCYDYSTLTWNSFVINSETVYMYESILRRDNVIIPNVILNTPKYNSVNGFVYLPINDTYNITVDSVGYLSRYLEHDFTNNNNLTSTMGQSQITINITESISGNLISNWTLYNGSDILINTTSNYGTFYPNPGEFNNLILVSNGDAFSNRVLIGFNVTSLEVKTVDYELLPTELNVSVQDYLGNTINNFTVTINNQDTYHVNSGTATTGSLVFGVINNNIYNVSIDATGYSLFKASQLVSIDGNTNKTFILYVTNSLDITFKNELDNTIIDSTTVYLEMISNTFSYNFSTTDGTLHQEVLSPEEYTIRYYATGFNERFYYYDLSDRSYTNLTLYLTNETTTNVTVNVYDTQGAILEGVTIHYLKYYASTNTYNLVGMVKTNFEGTAKIPLILNTEYYKFLLYYDGLLRETTIPTYIYDDTLTFKVSIVEPIHSLYFEATSGIYNADVTFNYNTNNFKFEFASPDGNQYEHCLYVYTSNVGKGNTLINSTCITLASGTILIGVSEVNDTTYLAEGFINYNNVEWLLDSESIKFNDYLPNKNLFLFMVLFLTMLFAFFGLYNLSIMCIMLPVPLFVSTLIGFIPISPMYGVGFLLLGFVMAWRVK